LKKKSQKKKSPSSAESKNGVTPVKFRGKECEQRITEKMGDDGVIETHVNISPAPKPYWGKATQRLVIDPKTGERKWIKLT
jgi:hypothetical protein